MLAGAAGSHPVVRLLQATQPLLAQIAATPALQHNAAVVSAVCEVMHDMLRLYNCRNSRSQQCMVYVMKCCKVKAVKKATASTDCSRPALQKNAAVVSAICEVMMGKVAL